MPNSEKLVSAQQLAATNRAHYPNESAEYRASRNSLLAEEIELRRHIERVADQRRVLPPGGILKSFQPKDRKNKMPPDDPGNPTGSQTRVSLFESAFVSVAVLEDTGAISSGEL